MTSDRRGRAIGCWLVVLTVLASVGGVAVLAPASAQATTSTANGTAGQNGTAAPPGGGTDPTDGGNATFNRSTVTQDRGDIAAVELGLTNASEATVTIGSRAVNYEANVTVADADDDGELTLLVNSYLAGTVANETRTYDTLAGADAIVGTNRTTEQLDTPLEASSYNLSVAVEGRETDTATLRLAERSTDELVTWTAPAASFGNVTNASEVAVALDDGRITTTDTVASGDVLVLQSKISGVYGALAAANVTELVERGVFNLTIRQTNPDTNRRPKRLDLDRSLANDSIRVIPDPDNDVLYVNVDTRAAVFERGPPRPGDEFETEFTVREGSPLAASNQSIAANVTVVGAELSLGDVSLAADAGQVVTGTTSVAPGSEVTVTIAANATGSFVKTNTTLVAPNGSFATSFNLSDTAPNTTVDVRAAGPLDTSDDVTVPVGPSRNPEPMAGGARLVVADQTTTGETIEVRSVTLENGGYVVVHAPNATEAPVGSVLGASSYLENGTTENVTVTLTGPLDESSAVVVMAHRDTNDNGVFDFVSSNGSEDVPYTSAPEPTATGMKATAAAETLSEASATTNESASTAGSGGAASDGDPVGVTVDVTVSNATTSGTVESTSTAAGGGNASTVSEGANDTGESGQSTSGNGPGFGIVAAAGTVVAIVVATAALATRRE